MTKVTECPHGGYAEKIDLSVEPWATLSTLCWGTPSAFRLGWAAEEHGVKENPFKSQFTRGVFEAGRQRCREFGTSNSKTMPTGAKT